MSESVKVAVRCRPLSNRELQEGNRNVVTIDPSSRSCTLEGSNGGKVYQFDATFGPESSTESVYENVGSVIVEAVLDGYNATVFAYGQTGCGKSHTMQGFVERALEHLFEATSTSGSEMRYLAILSYLEIYNEKLRDLLQDATGEKTLVLKEDSNQGTYVAGGLHQVQVKDATECGRLVVEGNRRRAAAATKMNAASSRSHAVLTLTLEAIAMDRDSTVRRGCLHLVDLAGSERQTRTGATGDRLKEAASINLSLSALGNVISALAAGNGRHVPYRDSKLTRLLKDSLGGNARTLMIACISPSDVDAEETLSTLRYAARARCIKNKPIVNEDPKDALLRQYQVELQRLRTIIETTGEQTTDTILREQDKVQDGYEEQVQRLKEECENSNLSALKLREELEFFKSRYETRPNDHEQSEIEENYCQGTNDRAERLAKKREAARQQVLKRLEKLTIGGEARGNDELKKRREKRRKKLQVLAQALETGAQGGNASGVYQVYGQLRSTEDALKRMAKKVKQLEAEAADLQASWDEERREFLRKELLSSQLCEVLIPYLRPGCPFRDIGAVKDAATWSDELGRWRLPDATSHVPLPPPNSHPPTRDYNAWANELSSKSDYNNNNCNHPDTNAASRECKKQDIVDTYFRRNRIDALLARVREAKTFEPSGRLSKSGGSEEPFFGPYHDTTTHHSQFTTLNTQNSAPITVTDSNGYKPTQRIGGWLTDEDSTIKKNYNGLAMSNKKTPPRILEALPGASTFRVKERTLSSSSSSSSARSTSNLHNFRTSPPS